MIQLSVVIPSRDAGMRLATCLGALAGQRDADGQFEVIVVDDGSAPPIDPQLRAPGASFPLSVLRRDESGGAGAARNSGWGAAKGRVCLFLDDDVVADPGLVAGHLNAHVSADRVVGVGRLTTQVPQAADWLMQRFAEMWNADVAVLDGGREPRAANCYSGNLSVPTALLHEVGGFDPSFVRSEDVELGARLVERGARLVFVPGANEHRERKSGRDILAGARANGEQAARLVAAHPPLLGEIELGTFAAWGQRHLAARRVAMALRIRPELLLPLARLVGRGRRARSALFLLLHLAYWAGVRGANPADAYEAMADGTAILMYHGFAPAGARGSRFVVPIERFEAQLRALLRRGHQPLSLSAYLEHRREHRFPPARSFVVTIDDGYTDVESLAAPVLRRLGVPATIFVVEGAIGSRNSWDRVAPLAGRTLLDDAALERLRGGGFDIAAHSATHRPMAGRSPSDLVDEIALATQRLAARLGPIVPAFAYPYGSVDPSARAAVTAAGLVGLGIDEGLACPASARDYLPRIEVRGTDSPLRLAFAAQIGGTRRLLRR
jgi:peptidoglycan/xylan/chitin deacetylase (PgdA/CDA1 family)/GT2 family glycosyltransferase